ncbi:MAG TPA: glycosyltransferase family 2 protein [Thermoleophilaceae bacterium]|nr:glycosyltransferase family 2 protein [Thermoleophilaceae bacterium]
MIIATWNAAGVLGSCLDSVERQRVRGGTETIVVDNASTDSTRELLLRYEGRIRVIANDVNARYAGANNQAAKVANGDVLFFLNSDTELRGTDVLERLAGAVEDPGIGIAGPLLLNPDGSLQPSCGVHPSVLRAVTVGVGAHRLLSNSARAGIAPYYWSHDRPGDTDWVMGAAIAIRAELFRELGGFWENMYAEEQDLAYRTQERGLRVRFERSATVMHIGNHSLAQQWSDAERATRVAQAELAFLHAHYGRVHGGAIRAITGTAYAGRAIVLRLLGRRARARVYAAMAQVYARGVASHMSWR